MSAAIVRPPRSMRVTARSGSSLPVGRTSGVPAASSNRSVPGTRYATTSDGSDSVRARADSRSSGAGSLPPRPTTRSATRPRANRSWPSPARNATGMTEAVTTVSQCPTSQANERPAKSVAPSKVIVSTTMPGVNPTPPSRIGAATARPGRGFRPPSGDDEDQDGHRDGRDCDPEDRVALVTKRDVGDVPVDGQRIADIEIPGPREHQEPEDAAHREDRQERRDDEPRRAPAQVAGRVGQDEPREERVVVALHRVGRAIDDVDPRCRGRPRVPGEPDPDHQRTDPAAGCARPGDVAANKERETRHQVAEHPDQRPSALEADGLGEDGPGHPYQHDAEPGGGREPDARPCPCGRHTTLISRRATRGAPRSRPAGPDPADPARSGGVAHLRRAR